MLVAREKYIHTLSHVFTLNKYHSPRVSHKCLAFHDNKLTFCLSLLKLKILFLSGTNSQ